MHLPQSLAAFCALLLASCANGGSGVAGTCQMDSDCIDDGVFCNGPAVCVEGACVQGTAPTCDDGVACTVDTCETGSDACQNTPDSTICGGDNVCDANEGCMPPNACEFDEDCTDDGLFCNGAESCETGLCQSAGMRDCDDGNSCTLDSCVEADDSCRHTVADNLNDPMACGRTGDNDCVVCPVPSAAQVNTTTACEAGGCVLLCDDGFFNSDGDITNGCECEAGAEGDELDADFRDTNCDGVDGVLSDAILLSTDAGNDNGTCGLELDRPCRTFAQAMVRAIEESRRDLFVMAGRYEEVVTLRDGIRIFGGYDTAWVRGPRSDPDHRTELVGAFSEDEGQYITVIAHDLDVDPVLENLVIIGPEAEMAGLSSYAVHVEGTDGLNILRSTILGGSGANGAPGTAGGDAAIVAATVGMQGFQGGHAEAFITTCDAFTHGAGGAAGTNSCPGSTAANGGDGGGGGTMDTSCVFVVCDDCTAAPGVDGVSASASTIGGFGFRGAAGGLCTRGTAGNNGRTQNGAAGPGATTSRGFVNGSYWVGNAGAAGGTGENGTGGGGGGGSGGCDEGFVPGDNSHGAGGGGGGAGGCAALGGGSGGGGGGGSFGVFALDSFVSLSNSELQRGQGGDGGDGGTGGRGQSGASGGPGGTSTNTTTGDGGNGGNGAHGGHGGGGGGGAGGVSAGVFTLNATVDASSSTIASGTPGAAGSGGASPPSAPLGERDGNAGLSGVNGELSESFECADASSC